MGSSVVLVQHVHRSDPTAIARTGAHAALPPPVAELEHKRLCRGRTAQRSEVDRGGLARRELSGWNLRARVYGAKGRAAATMRLQS
jgi:hypothetical protein